MNKSFSLYIFKYDLTFPHRFNVYFTLGAFLSTFIFLNFNRHDGMRCHVEFHCSRKVPIAKHYITRERSFLMAPNIEFYYLFFLLHTLCLTNTDSHKKLVRRFIFRLKKYHLFFLTFMRYQIVLLSFLLKFLKIKKNLSSWILFSICYNRWAVKYYNEKLCNYYKTRLSKLIQYKNTHVKYMLSWNLNVININFFATRAEEFHVQLFDHH